MKPKLIILQTVIMPYRLEFFKYLRDVLGEEFQIYYGSKGFEPSLKSVIDLPYKTLTNLYFLNHSFCFQIGMWKAVMKPNTVIVLGLNPRIISHWIILVLRKLIRGRTVLWGHAWSRKGRYSKTEFLRGCMRNLADEIITYSDEQKEELKELSPNKEIKSAPNALYLKKDIEIEFENTPRNFLYVGRLISEKKITLLLKAFNKIKSELTPGTKLIIVGSGEQYDELKLYVDQNGLENSVILTGPIHSLDDLKPYYSQTLATIAPGSVGLFLVQSLSFGVPMLIAKNEPHGPELELSKTQNILFFRSDDISDLAAKLLDVNKNAEKWVLKRQEFLKESKVDFTVEAMAAPFIELAQRYGS